MMRWFRRRRAIPPKKTIRTLTGIEGNQVHLVVTGNTTEVSIHMDAKLASEVAVSLLEFSRELSERKLE